MEINRNKILYNPLFIAGILTIVAVLVSVQSLLLQPYTFGPDGIGYTRYNNYLIFKQSFFHLIENHDLYKLYLREHHDYYKYSPAFSLLMFPFAYLPDPLGLFAWNLLNTLILFFA